MVFPPCAPANPPKLDVIHHEQTATKSPTGFSKGGALWNGPFLRVTNTPEQLKLAPFFYSFFISL